MPFIDECYQRDKNIIFREIVGEAVLVPIRQNVGDLESIYTLNESAASIWGMLDGEKSLAQIAERLTQEFEVERPQAQADILELVTKLVEIGVVNPV